MKIRLFFICLSLSLVFNSCVSSKKYKNLQAEIESVQKMLDAQKNKLSDCETAKMDLEKQLASAKNELGSSKGELSKFQNQVSELEKMNKQKELEIQKIKDDIRAAFSSVNSADLSIHQVADKLYVSLPNHILYKKGSPNLNKNGQDILKNLSAVFVKNAKMNITVEGHADKTTVKSDAPYKDNLDLSTLRSGNVIRYLIKQGVGESQLTASGRSSFEPTGVQGEGNDTLAPDRRIEFIITPDIAKLYEISKKK